MSKVPARWEAMSEVVRLRNEISPRTQIILNGDVESVEQGNELAEKYGVDGIMIGRGIFHDPFLFSGTDKWANFTKADKIELFKKHINLFDETWGTTRRVHVLNKFCKVYIEGFDGAKDLREKLMVADDVGELLNILDNSLLQ